MAAPGPEKAGPYDTRSILAWRVPETARVDLTPAQRRYLTDEAGDILCDENGEPFRDGDVP